MLFNSYTFLIFLALVLIVWDLRLSWAVRKGFLLGASYLFYAAWNPPFVLLLLLSTVVDWFLAKSIHRAESTRSRQLYLLLSLCVNFGLLGYFKYADLMLQSAVWLAGCVGWHLHTQDLGITLPVGISFYTFQTLSYTFDVYRGRLDPWRSFLDYALYVTFFPQLVAGPIVRAEDFLPQCFSPKRASGSQVAWGGTLLALGLFCKVVIADHFMAPVAEQVYDHAATLDALSAWAGTLAFSAQIFCDFAGYSTCAIGVALCLGFSLPSNFRYPYAAVGFSDFWCRWHISLSTWLRDYLYIPLGGNRRGAHRTRVNLMVTMLLGGLWHGAAWTFVVWGGVHGLLLMAEHALRPHLATVAWVQCRPCRLAMACATYIVVCFTWVLFRARSFPSALSMLSAMCGVYGLGSGAAAGVRNLVYVGLVTSGLLAIHHFMANRTLEVVYERTPWPVRSLVIAVCVLLTFMTFSGEEHAFIYFQF